MAIESIFYYAIEEGFEANFRRPKGGKALWATENWLARRPPPAAHAFYWLCMSVSIFTLIRFFFAPSHNVGVVVKLINNRKNAARVVMFFDISLLLAHSFVFFRMCYALGDMRYNLFYRDFSILLLLNAMWLATITFRQKRAKINPHDKHAFWQLNNFICGSLILVLFLFKADIALMFLVAIANCVLDLWSCAPYYFENV